MVNDTVTTDWRIMNPTHDTDEAVGRLLLASSDRSASPGVLFLSDSPYVDRVQGVLLWPQGSPLLAEVANTFEHFGLRIADRETLRLPDNMNASAQLHKFTFAVPNFWKPDHVDRVSEAFAASVSAGFAIDDFAKLVSAAGFTWRQVSLVRAATRFIRQAGLGLSDNYVIDTLLRNTRFADALVRMFAAKFDPSVADRPDVLSEANSDLDIHLHAATTLDEDRILRSLRSFVNACVRTNWYQVDSTGAPKPYASFKLNSAELALPSTIVPHREIFVYSDDVEGIHARAGKVARGGIRFSDRLEDYRTEVLGLMKTQDVKNSPIVPVGAKGAFVRKSIDITAAEAYSTFISGLLDVTDNIVDGAVVEPDHTVSYEDTDTYLVVAADKGTASFSDLANSISLDRRYWLGDAFASGGSAGFDHKAMGITARGAWISVRRHFDELGTSLETDGIRVVGIGDMSGDVFGNGMLLTHNLRLVAAFDHRHIFVDPDPDTDRSFAERQRLTTLPHSTWDDYDRTRMSAGGGIWPRTSKAIELSSRAQQILGLDSPNVAPTELVKAILCAEVDLLWNGGIGTYVKASDESDASAADPSNDPVRIDATMLRCRVIGEGGNLGLTQRARIEYSLAGGRANADFIDNAAGVATSDFEVNLKIALDVAVRNGRIDQRRRNALLEDSQVAVAQAVIANCESQVLAISLAESQAAQLLNRHERLIEYLETNSGISRANEVLPTRKELVSRTQAGLGLTRPEIAVLLAQSKNIVRMELLDSNVPDDPLFASALHDYFPQRVRDELPIEIGEHRLSREIIATRIADDLINHVGPGLIYQLEERLGVKTAAVARAYAVIRGVFDVDNLWQRASRFTNHRERWQYLHAVQHFIEQSASWVLRKRPAVIDIENEIARYLAHANELTALRNSTTTQDAVEELRHRSEDFELIETALLRNCAVETVAGVHAQTGELLSLFWLTDRLEDHVTTNWWDSMASAIVRNDLAERHHELVRALIPSENPDGSNLIEGWRVESRASIERFTRMVSEIRRDGVVDVSRACTAAGELLLLVRSAAGDMADAHSSHDEASGLAR
nr:NAD-glutamate dehydrogenase domain-containing protein [Rhodococcus sp. (in: high G+C Gram-positive bacteria)]